MKNGINLLEKLQKERVKIYGENDIIHWAYSVLEKNKPDSPIQRLRTSPTERNTNNFNLDELEFDNIFHI